MDSRNTKNISRGHNFLSQNNKLFPTLKTRDPISGAIIKKNKNEVL